VIAHAERQEKRQALRPSDNLESDPEVSLLSSSFSNVPSFGSLHHLHIQNGESDSSMNSQDNAVTDYANKLFEKHEMNKKYNKTYPPIIDPADSTRYFALTWKKAQEWAKHRVSPICLSFN
jgi:hypothetical protein